MYIYGLYIYVKVYIKLKLATLVKNDPFFFISYNTKV